MALSLQDRMALLPAEERIAWLAAQPDYIIEEIMRGEWWWTARPEQIPPEGNWFICLALAGRGWGKDIDPSINIAAAKASTPAVFRFIQMKDLEVGDWVLDETGAPCRITDTVETNPEICYRVQFSDGSFINASATHEWVTWTHADRKAYLRSEYVDDKTVFPKDWPNWRSMSRGRGTTPKVRPNAPGPRIRTTQDIADTFSYNARGDRNHCIPNAGALQLPKAGLPLDPWVLGYWLGNGSAADNTVACHGDDAQFVINTVISSGEWNAQPTAYQNPDRNCITVRIADLQKMLRHMDVLDNKHIPEAYLWASVDQRKALLAGLLDSDGYIEEATQYVEFCSTNKNLADGVMHLARSLGEKPRMYEGRATLYGEDHGEKYRVCWRPTFNPFLSPRKRSAYAPPDSQGLRNRHRMITDIERIDPMPMRCITVDSPNHMYLAGEALIPTHNSRSGSEWIVDRVQKHPFDSTGTPTEWLVIAETLSDARTICMEGPAGILRVLDRRQIKHRYKMSPRPMILFPDGAKIYTEGADDPDVGRGYNASGAWLDEVCKWRLAKDAWEGGIMPSLRADLIGDHPRAFVTTTPKPLDLFTDWVSRNDGTVHVIRGSTFDNAGNLSRLVIEELKRRYEGTAIGRQELYGEILEGFEGALFSRLDIANHRVDDTPDGIVATVVGVDPSLTGEDDEMGIVVVSRDRDRHMYIQADRSIMAVGRAAALEAWRVVAEYGADKLVVEENLGKRWMRQVFTDAYKELVDSGLFPQGSKPPLVGVDAKLGKRTRGEPVAMRSEQGRLHVVGHLQELEDQMATFTAWGQRESPDRLDAMVHACRFLMDGEKKEARVASPADVLSTTLRDLLTDVSSYNY